MRVGDLRVKFLYGSRLIDLKPGNLEVYLVALFKKFEVSGKVIVHFMGEDETGPSRDSGVELLTCDLSFIRLRVWLAKKSRPYICGIVASSSPKALYEKLGGVISRTPSRNKLSGERLKTLRKSSAMFAEKMQRAWEKRKEGVLAILRANPKNDSNMVSGRVLRGAVIQVCPKVGRSERYYEILKRLKKDGAIKLMRGRKDGEDTLYEIVE
mgnify:CR=1 FL=1